MGNSRTFGFRSGAAFALAAAVAVSAVLAVGGCGKDPVTPPDDNGKTDTTGSSMPFGRLFASGNKIVGTKSGGAAVQLKGVSFQWSVAGWGSEKFFITDAVDAMIDGWKAQVIRAPLGIGFNKGPDHSVANGYNTHPEANWERVERVVDATIAKKVYAIVDWHSHTAHDPAETALAIDFFTNPNLAGKYGNHPAVIFEIYNEPENDVEWPELKEYANTVIKAIRDAGFNNLILVGSQFWDLAVDVAAQDPPEDPLKNFAFTFHFYADGHRADAVRWFSPKKAFSAAVKDALDAGYPVFVSEWGTNNASSAGNVNLAEADKWHAFLDENRLSSCAWGVMGGGGNVLYFWDRDGNPLQQPNPSALAAWTSPGGMTAHGRYVYHWLTGNDTTYTITGPTYTGERLPIELLSDELSGYGNDEGNDSTKVSLEVEDGVMRITYEFGQGDYPWTPYAGVHHSIDWLSGCGYGLGYTYKGSPHTMRIEQSDVTNWAFHSSNYTEATDEWTDVVIPWAHFRQPDWNDEPIRVNPENVEAISWYTEGAAGTGGEFWVKDVRCLVDAEAGSF